MKIRDVGEVDPDSFQPVNEDSDKQVRVEWIPCMRTSFLTGISSGLGVGLLHFLFTSRVNRSYNVSLSVYLVVTLGRYFQCRWNLSTQKFEAQKLKYAMEKLRSARGTEEDPALMSGEKKTMI